MKYFTLSILVIILISNQLIAQNSHSKNNILEIDYFNHKVVNLNIVNAKNVVSFEEKIYKNIFNEDGFDLTKTSVYQLKKGKVISRTYKTKYFDTKYTYFYKNNYKILDKCLYESKSGYNEEYTFKFDKKNRLIEMETFQVKINSRTKKYMKYDDSNKTIEKYTLDSKDNKEMILTYKMDRKGNVIEKFKKKSKYRQHDSQWIFEYNNKLQVIKATKNKKTKDATNLTNDSVTSSYVYNSNGLISEDNGNYSESGLALKDKIVYDYVYDKYNNWIVMYKLSTSYGYQDFKSDGYRDIREIKLRKLTYKNGEVTGQTDENASVIKNYLNTLVKNNPFKTKRAPKDGVYWSKVTDNSIKLFDYGKHISPQLNYVNIVGNGFYVNDSISNKFYHFKDFKSKPNQESYYKATLFANADDLVWYKNKKDLFVSVQNGRYVSKQLKLKYAKNGIDVIVKSNEQPKYVMINARDVQQYIMCKALPYKSYLVTHPNESIKSESDQVPTTGFIWKKNIKNQFWIYENGVSDNSKLITNKFFNHQIVYDKINNRSYLLMDFTNKEPNKFFNITKLKGNIFWYKTKDKFGIFKNGKAIGFGKSQYAQNKIDIIIYAKDSDTKLYVLKNYVKNGTFELLPVINYADYIENP